MGRPLYIFLHIPKCAGNTIMRKLQKDCLDRLWTPMYTDEKPDAPSEKFCGKEIMDACFEELNGVVKSADKKFPDCIDFIHSHHVYYGIHEFFKDREPRYIAFFRDPAEMICSWYNYGLGIPKYRHLSRTIFRDGKRIDFVEWVKNNPYYAHNFLYNFLKDRYFIDEWPCDLNDMINKFWFIGTTPTLESDFEYLINHFELSMEYRDHNISSCKIVTPDKIVKYRHHLMMRIRDILLPTIELDIEIWNTVKRFKNII